MLSSTSISVRNTPILHLLLLWAAPSLLLLVFPGCRGATSVQVDVLEQELRQQEDYIYELEDYLVEYSDKLRRARCTNLSDSGTGTKKSNPSTQPTQPEIILDGDDLGGLPDDIPDDISILPQSEIEDNPESATPLLKTPPAENQQSPTPDDFDNFEVPDVEIEDPGANYLNGASLPWPIADAENNVSSPLQVATSSNPLMIPNPVGYRSILERPLSDSPAYPVHQAATSSANPNSQESADPSANPSIDGPSADAQAWDSSTLGNAFEEEETAAIDRIVIQQLLHQSPSRHPNEGHAPQDSSPQPTTSQRSLLAVVEIRDLSNEPVEAVGKLSLMVMAVPASSESIESHLPDRSKPRRIQRWDFSAEEVSLAWQSSSLGDGLHLEMPLAAERLPQESLELWARLVTVDGQKHLTKRPFHPQQLVAWQNPPLVTPEDEISPVMEGAIRLTDSTTQERTSPHRKESHRDRLQPIQHQATIHHQAIGAKGTATGTTPQWRAAQTQPLLPARSPATSGTSPRWVAQAGTDQSRTN